MQLTTFDYFPHEEPPKGVTLLILNDDDVWHPVSYHRTIDEEPYFLCNGLSADGPTFSLGSQSPLSLVAFDTKCRDRPGVFIPEEPTREQVQQLIKLLYIYWEPEGNHNSYAAVQDDLHQYGICMATSMTAGTRVAGGWQVTSTATSRFQDLGTGPEEGLEGVYAATRCMLKHIKNMYLDEES